ncbi:MAG: hypothetical protein AB7S38_06885 [Vulcanimicrobiota bacterium]
MRLAWFLTLFMLLPSAVQAQPVRALKTIHQTQQLRASVLPANSGWQRVYLMSVEARQGDLLVIDSQVQFTIDSAEQVGQQFRLTVNGKPVGTRVIQVNEQPGSHHLPMRAMGLFKVPKDGTYEVSSEGSAFHSGGDFPVTIDHADNLSYGNLLVEHYHLYTSRDDARNAYWLQRYLQGPPPLERVYGQTPYQQEAISTLGARAGPDELWRVSGQALGVARNGMEMLAGVLTNQAAAISPYGGENVLEGNLFAPLQFEAVVEPQAGPQNLEFRVYGGFGHGFALYPGSNYFDLLVFGQQPSYALSSWATAVAIDCPAIASNQPLQELVGRDLFLAAGELVRLRGNVQFARPETDGAVTAECQMRLAISDGQSGVERHFQKNLTPRKVVLPLSGTLSFQAPRAGTYRLSLKASGFCPEGAVRLRLDAEQTQLQLLHYQKDSSPS